MADLTGSLGAQGLNPNEVEPQGDMSPVPDGEYVAQIIDSEVKPTKAGTGEYLALTGQIIDGQYKNRMFWTNINLRNPNAQAVQIGQRELSAVCHAVNMMSNLTDSVHLHNKPLIVKLELVPAKGEFKARNEVKAWKPLPNQGAAPAPTQQQPPPAQPAQQPAAAATPPWQQAS